MKKLLLLMLVLLTSVFMLTAQTVTIDTFEPKLNQWDNVQTSTGEITTAIVANPSQTGLNLSDRVLRVTRAQSSTNNWVGTIAHISQIAAPTSGNRYLHMLMYRTDNHAPGLKVTDTPPTGVSADLDPISPTSFQANTWVDVVFDVTAFDIDFIFIMTDKSASLSAASVTYFDDIILSSSSSPRTTPSQPASVTLTPGAADSEGYRLMWNEDFTDAAGLDQGVWTVEVTDPGAYNNELQSYTREAVTIEEVDGKKCLTLTASRSGDTFSSGRVNSQEKFNFLYGKIEARIYFPNTLKGLWPAFWMMGDDIAEVGWPQCGETDIIELGNSAGFSNPTKHFAGANHWGTNSHSTYNPVVYDYAVTGGFHTFTLIWTPTSMAMYVDRDEYPNVQPYYQMDISSNSYFKKPNHILFNLAVGGDYTGNLKARAITTPTATAPAKMYVDYVRIYQKDSDTGHSIFTYSPSDPIEGASSEEPAAYTLTWNLAGGTISQAGTAAGSYAAGTAITAPTVTRSGYTFAGWTPSVPATMPASNATYTATWTAQSTPSDPTGDQPFETFEGGAALTWNAVETTLSVRDNPDRSGLNRSCQVLRGVRVANPEINWNGMICNSGLPTSKRYLHVLMYRTNANPPKLKVNDDTPETLLLPVNASSVVANEWQDMVFDLNGLRVDFLFFLIDHVSEIPFSVAMYIDDLIYSDSATPRTTPNAEGDCTPTTVDEGWTLRWNEDFTDAAGFSTDAWTKEVHAAGYVNNELQAYTQDAVSIETFQGKKCLALTATKNGTQITSGRINSNSKVQFKYGKIEARIYLPNLANGLWPAFWMMGTNTGSWPACGETDIMEMGEKAGIAAGTQDRYLNGAQHWGASTGAHQQQYSPATYPYALTEGFHTFTCIWSPTSVAMYIDQDSETLPYYQRDITQSSNNTEAGYYFHQLNHILFNLAVGGDFPGITSASGITALNGGPAKMYVDYVRIYQKGDPGEQLVLASGVTSDPIESADPVTVTWSVDGVVTQANYLMGDALTLPAAPAASCGRSFVGWTSHSDYAGDAAGPDDLFTTAGGKTVEANTTYYAVFATSGTPATTQYSLVSTLTAGNTYVFASAQAGATYIAQLSSAPTTADAASVPGVAVTVASSTIVGSYPACEVSYDGNGLLVGTNYLVCATARVKGTTTARWQLASAATNAFAFSGNQLMRNVTANTYVALSGTTFVPSLTQSSVYAFEKTIVPASFVGATLHPCTAPSSYTIAFVNYDGTPLQSGMVEVGQMPVYNGATPTKAATVQWTYTFKGWTPALTAVTEEASYMAEYDSVLNEYTIIFKGAKGETLQSGKVAYGTVPTFTKATPTKEADAANTYAFSGWSPSVVAVTGNAEYVAQFTATAIIYELGFEAGEFDGGVITISGETTYGSVVTLTATPNEGYEFSGWGDGNTDNPRQITIGENLSLNPSFAKQQHEIVFKNYDGTELQKGNVEHGSVPAYNGAEPTKTETAQYTYSFKEWSPAIVAATAPAEYVATFDSIVREYTIVFKGATGQTLQSGKVAYGTVPTYNGVEPSKDADATNTYAFSGWSPSVVAVTGEAEYVAQFTATAIVYELGFEAGEFEGGVITISGETTYGSVVTLTATPNEGYEFNGWGDGNTDNPRQITIGENLSLNPTFERIDYTVSIVAEHATYEIEALNGYYAGETITITLTPDEGYEFTAWGDGNTDNPRVIVLSANVELSVTCTEVVVPVDPTAVDQIEQTKRVEKIYREGHVYILTPEGIFTPSGRRLE